MIGTKTDRLKIGTKKYLKSQLTGINKSKEKKVESSAIKTKNRMDNNTISTARVTTKQKVVICLLTQAIPDLFK
jgi:hypothetical protein